jgi:hypothetical protein
MVYKTTSASAMPNGELSPSPLGEGLGMRPEKARHSQGGNVETR